jgi:hypothetical protein
MRLVIARQAGAGKDDAFNEVALGADGADLRQIRPQCATDAADLVAWLRSLR